MRRATFSFPEEFCYRETAFFRDHFLVAYCEQNGDLLSLGVYWLPTYSRFVGYLQTGGRHSFWGRSSGSEVIPSQEKGWRFCGIR